MTMSITRPTAVPRKRATSSLPATGCLSAGADAQIAALARNEEIPFIGPSTLLPHSETPVNRYVFYLLPGVAEQSVSLVNFATARPEQRQAKIAIVYSDNQLGLAAAEVKLAFNLEIAIGLVGADGCLDEADCFIEGVRFLQKAPFPLFRAQ